MIAFDHLYNITCLFRKFILEEFFKPLKYNKILFLD